MRENSRTSWEVPAPGPAKFPRPVPALLPSGVNHSELVKAAEKAFRTLPVSPNLIPLAGCKAHPNSDFISLEVHVCNDDIPTAHLGVAAEGVSWSPTCNTCPPLSIDYTTQ